MVIRPYSRFSFPYRPVYGYLVFVLLLLVMSWEGQRTDAAVAGGRIPEESIRLRILANSDAPADQAVKRHVRDAVVAAMTSYAAEPQTMEEARAVIRGRLPELERLVGDTLAARGFHYGYRVELGTVPFPTKMYGSIVYPAGNYEALRITLGDGLGQNWWCVLFPPLCFVDGVTGEASPKQAAAAAQAAAGQAAAVKAGGEAGDGASSAKGAASAADASVKRSGDQASAAAASAAVQAGGTDSGSVEEQPEVRFFVWELLQRVASFFRGLFG